MRIEHLIVGAIDVEVSARFYVKLLGFEPCRNSFTGEGRTLTQDGCDLIILSFDETKLPNPFHVAFEVPNHQVFQEILRRAGDMGAKPRTLPQLDSRHGAGTLEKSSGELYENFYVLDPTGVNVEVMCKRSR